MRTQPAALATHIGTRDTTVADALKITRTDGQVFAFTSNDVDDLVNGVTYLANPGLNLTDIAISAGAGVGNLELRTLHDGTLFTLVDIFGGLWRNAPFQVFRYNFESIADGIDTLLVGTLGEFELRDNELVVELRDLRQYLQQPVGEVSSKTCRARLGDARCRKDLTAFTKTGTLTHVTSNQIFRDASRGEDSDFFGEGEIEFTSGANDGLRAKIKSFAVGSPPDGTFTLALPMIGTVSAGDTYIAIAGCRKRLEEDCLGKFDNVLNFQGEPHRRGLNNVIQRPTADV